MYTFGFPLDLEEAKYLARPFLISLGLALAIQIIGNVKYLGLLPRSGSDWHLALLRFSAAIAVLFSLFGVAERDIIIPGIGFVFAMMNLVLGYSAPKGIRGPMLVSGWGSLGFQTFGAFLVPAVSS